MSKVQARDTETISIQMNGNSDSRNRRACVLMALINVARSHSAKYRDVKMQTKGRASKCVQIVLLPMNILAKEARTMLLMHSVSSCYLHVYINYISFEGNKIILIIIIHTEFWLLIFFKDMYV